MLTTSVGPTVPMATASRRFSAAVAHAFESLDDRAIERPARSGPLALRLHFASSELADAFNVFLPPLPGSSPVLEICFTTSRYVNLSDAVPQRIAGHAALANDDVYALWQFDSQHLLHIVDFASRRAVVWLGDDFAPAWLCSRPILAPIHAVLLRTPWVPLHGGAVSLNGRTLLLAGIGRAGKTTAALACALAGWDYAGDDFVLVNSQTALVEPLFTSARLRNDLSSLFPGILDARAEISHEDGEVRHELRMEHVLQPDQLTGGKAAALLLPRRRGAERPEFEPARPIDAFNALLTMTVTLTPGWPDLVSKKLMSVIGLAPIFFIDTGATPNAIPDAFAEFLHRL